MALHLRVAGACNLDCVFCSYPDRSLRFDLPALARRAAASGERHIQVSGGEPLAAPREGLFALLGWLKKHAYSVELQTNGTLAAELSNAHLARLAGLIDLANVNCSAPDAATDLLVTRTRGAFARRAAGIRRLCAAGVPVRLTYVVCALNLDGAARFPAMAARRFPEAASIQFSFVKGQGRSEGRADLVPTHAEAAPFLRRALAAARGLGLRAEVDHIPVCHLPGFAESHVDTEKMRRRAPGRHLLEKRRLSACAGCPSAGLCPGVRADYTAIHGG